MKHLRQYIRQILLTEGMKTVADLHDGVVVVVRAGANDTKVYYGVAAEPSNLANNRHNPPYGDIDLTRPSALGGDLGMCGDAWMVSGAFAAPGWGPLLYDVAIEWASQNGGGLIADRSSVSRAARRVWNYYMTNRGDVQQSQLDNLEDELTPGNPQDNCDQSVSKPWKAKIIDIEDWTESPLSKAYTKNQGTMDRLMAAGKLVIL